MASTLPFESPGQNLIEIFNEMMIYIIAVFAMCLVGLAVTVDDNIEQSRLLTYLVLFKVLINILIIVRVTYKSLKLTFKRWYNKRYRKKQVSERQV